MRLTRSIFAYKISFSPRYLCYTYRAKHITYRSMKHMQLRSARIRLFGRRNDSIKILGPPNCTEHLILLCFWNCLRDNNYVLQFYCIRLCGRLGLPNLGISGDRSTDKYFCQDQEKQQISFFVKHFPVKNSDRLVATAPQNVLDFQFLK